MEKASILIFASVLLILFGIIFYRIMKGYVRDTFGQKWLSNWGNKAYFWQSLVYMSTACTGIVLYTLKWTNVLTF